MNIHITIPQTWNDLTEKQLEQIALGIEHYRALPERQQKQGVHLGKLYVHLIKNLLRHNNWFKLRYALKQILPSEYKQYIQFVLEKNQRTKFPTAFKVNRKKVYPPEDRLQNATTALFSFADTLFYRYRETNQEIYLSLLCATLYREKGKYFDKIEVEKQVGHWQKVSRTKKLAILYAYEGSRSYIFSLYPKVFQSTGDDEETKTTERKKYTPFGKLIHYKADYDPYKLEAIEQLNIHKFLSIYQNEREELQKQQRYAKRK